MSKYFAMIEGRQQGPFTLSELPGAGVTPDTYVWCRGMEDWEQASKVADICRYYRQRLSGSLPEDREKYLSGPAPYENTLKEKQQDQPAPVDLLDPQGKPKLRDIMQEVNRIYEEEMQERANPTRPPRVSLALAIATTLLCFPPTGFVAIYQCTRATGLWKSAAQGEEGREQRIAAHDAARLARMWTGITLCLGMISWAAICRFA